MPTRAEQKEKRRWEILEAALDLFIRRGFAATKISDIAGAVGMSQGLLFHYFESKEKLFEELVEIGVYGPRSMTPPSGVPPLAYFEQVAIQLLQYILQQPFTCKMFAFMANAMFSEGIPPTCREKLAAMDSIGPSAVLIELGQREGSIRPGNPLALSATFWMSLQGVAVMRAMWPDAPCPEPEWIVDILRAKPKV